jgi:beta-N-acetylhexosaminidase
MRSIRNVFIFCIVHTVVFAQQQTANSNPATAQTPDLLNMKIGQMIMIGFPKAEVDKQVLEDVRTGKVGTIILFEKNIPKSASAYTALKKIIWTYQNAAPMKLLVGIDQEGGKVNRLKDKYGFTRSITAQEMGRAGTLDSVKFYAEATAATLAGLGININFAPVVDVAVNKENTVIYKAGRSFSSNPDSVAMFAAEFIKPHRRYGVITVLKHFPGHGSSLADTHFGVADVSATWTQKELVPYQNLLGQGMVDAVMSAHIVNKQLDPRGLPGTLSSRMIDSLLRNQIRFDGVVISDDMQMQAIAKQYGLEESIKLAINAGVDILCFGNNVTGSEERTVDKVHGIIRALVDKGEIKPERIDQSFNRILNLKYRAGLSSEEFLRIQLEAARKELADLKRPIEVKQEVKPDSTAPVQQPAPAEEGKKKKKKKN